jgi:hypothetical protein
LRGRYRHREDLRAWRLRRSTLAIERTYEPGTRDIAVVGISVSAGLATVDVRDFAGDLGIHSDSSAGVFDGQ